jgi:hypothetical protein
VTDRFDWGRTAYEFIAADGQALLGSQLKIVRMLIVFASNSNF